jgi:ribosome-binding protein aMBF1 (putative translation factor)
MMFKGEPSARLALKFSFVRDIAERVVEQNNQLIQKLESLIGEGIPF